MNSSAGATSQQQRENQANTRSLKQRLLNYIGDQLAQLQPAILLTRILLSPLPRFTFGHVRAAMLKMIGFRIGKRSGFYGTPRIFGRGDLTKRLTIGEGCWINIGCHFDLSESIVIGDNVGIGPEVMIMTGTHEMGPDSCRAGRYIALPVTISEGAWVGARCIIMPGVTIGKGAVISAGTVVSRDVPPNTIMIGTQGMPIEKWLALTRQGPANRASPGAR